jgi:hypothetical protein
MKQLRIKLIKKKFKIKNLLIMRDKLNYNFNKMKKKIKGQVNFIILTNL